ncbi:MAG: DNA-directed RNA polymerase subunit K [Promethearchaeota archaeon]
MTISRTLQRYEEYIAAERRIKIGSIFITRYERSRIIGARALQISFQASPFMDIPPEMTDPIEIAAYELENKFLPITIKRKMPTGNFQMIPVSWLINENY